MVQYLQPPYRDLFHVQVYYSEKIMYVGGMFAELSLHVATFFITCFMSYSFSSRSMPESKFAIYDRAAEVCSHRILTLVLPLGY